MNATTTRESIACPFSADRDDRKSAKIAAQRQKPQDNAKVIAKFSEARDVLRSPQVLQYGADPAIFDNPDHASFFFLDGDVHRRRRAAVAGFFAPRTIATRYHDTMQRTMDELIAALQAEGSAVLDLMSFRMAVDVAALIIGLTESDSTALAHRLRKMLGLASARHRILPAPLAKILLGIRVMNFERKDLAPAVAARRKEPRDDVISYMVKEGYSKKSMIIECMTYGTAGMLTTREFIVMVAWHLFENDALRHRYLAGDADEQFAILEEILRLEPVAAMVHRNVAATMPETAGGLASGEVLSIDIRAANTDEAIAGTCPFALDPDRAKRMKVVGAYMSFGDGPHRCPGAQVALHETRIFMDRLLRVPGIRLANQPEMSWNEMLGSYELRGAVVTCERAEQN